MVFFLFCFLELFVCPTNGVKYSTDQQVTVTCQDMPVKAEKTTDINATDNK